MSLARLRYALSLTLFKFLSFPLSYPAKLHTHSSPPFIRNVNDAVASFNRMLNMRLSPSIVEFNKILASLSKTKHFHIAIALFQQLGSKGIEPTIPNTITFNTFMNGLCLINNVRKALHLHDKTIAQGFQMDQPADIITYNSLIHALFKNHHVDWAIALLNKVIDKGIHPNAYTNTILIDGLCKSGRLKDAIDTFEDLLVKGYHLNVRSYNVVISGLCREGLLDEALALKSRMEDSGYSPDDAVTFEIIIRALFEKHEHGKAEKLLLDMVARGLLQE
ncbi:putative pentatricopeptide repeat-containing protein At3g16710, mitochondrial [Abrus precatorius]|uniref:Pentatricopeptide repeat-containing protein At3g16710, mitochondrial n=1 Tax=Abrus precatorius TaxID=3816 RepID=A0A8B8LNE7_ABRPR|nr:putative pentatricopeptide repeat-containing protein At3g16710, mitochondrial [Abrus precatorius]